MAAKSKPLSSDRAWLKPGPFADLGILTVRADQPSEGNSSRGRRHRIIVELCYPCTPAELHTSLNRAVHKELMQFHAANGKARRTHKIGASGMLLVHKLDSAEWKATFMRQGNPECS